MRFLVTANWQNNAPHLTEAARRDLDASIPPYQKAARTEGIPQLGAGVIYPVPDEDILVEPFPIPAHWPRGFGLDVGWNRTAAIWRAKNPDTGISYLYDEHYRGEAEPEVHAASIRRRGIWIPGRIDPAARGRNQTDGKKLLDMYRRLIYGEEDRSKGARLLGIAKNAIESGIYDVWMALSDGRLKVMRGRCPNWLAERRLYRRDERGAVVKKHDHAQDAGRYCVASGDQWLAASPAPATDVVDPAFTFGSGHASAHDGLAWMGH